MRQLVLLTALFSCALPGAWAQSFCASDGQPRPVALVERFISADCEACWADTSSHKPAARELAIDWIVPSDKGDEAPLSAAASRDARLRLEALGRPIPAAAEAISSKVRPGKRPLRVAHGLPFNGYIGASIEMKPAAPGPWTAWLLLVETIAAGSEGTPVARNLARNLFVSTWNGREPLSESEQARFFESRPMAIPEGARPERLRVVGWVEDARGRIGAIAQSRCMSERTGG